MNILTKFYDTVVFIITNLLFLISCTQAPKIEAPPPQKPLPSYEEQRAALPPPVSLPGAEALTIEGENFEPRLSANDNQILFVSRNRIQHKHEQIYLYDFNTLKEKRITWNDGVTIHPVFDSSQHYFFYSSNTDELKENPILLKKMELDKIEPGQENSKMNPLTHLENSEIYLSSMDGEEIVRLTEHIGFDGFFNKTKKGVIYLSLIKDSFHIHLSQLLKSKKLSNPKVLFKTNNPITDLNVSEAQNKLAWIQLSPSVITTSQLVVTDFSTFQPRSVSLPEGYYQNPFWLNLKDKLLISAKLKDKSNFQIYLVDIAKNCIKPLIDFPGDNVTPTVNQKNTFVIFSNISQSGQQLFKKNMDLNSIECQ